MGNGILIFQSNFGTVPYRKNPNKGFFFIVLTSIGELTKHEAEQWSDNELASFGPYFFGPALGVWTTNSPAIQGL